MNVTFCRERSRWMMLILAENARESWQVVAWKKVPIVAASSLKAAGHPIHAKISPVLGLTSEALVNWAQQNFSSSCSVLSEGSSASARSLQKAAATL
jgi:hypothetical protein